MDTTQDFWNPHLYQDKHAFVYGYGEALIELLNPQPHERILDLGCGAGQLSAEIARRGAKVTGLDASAEMIADAQRNFPELKFIVADAADFHFEQPFDAIFSNASLHWVLRYRQAIGCMYNALKAGGRLVLEMGGAGNIQRIEDQLRHSLEAHGFMWEASMPCWFFPTIGQYTSALEAGGFLVKMAQHYDRPTELADESTGIKDWLRMFARSFFEAVPEKEQQSIMEEVQEQLRPHLFRDGKWYADYKRLRVVAVKEAQLGF
ncbi:MAG: class I SAM-dependent methyltransferase [Cyclobacteriaceae bacterium]